MSIPPYGRFLSDMLANGFRPSGPVFIYAGQHAWDWASRQVRITPDILLFPPDAANPMDYHWPVCRCGCLIIATTPIVPHSLAAALFRDGAESVIYQNAMDTTHTLFYSQKGNHS